MATTALPTTEYTWGVAQMERHTADGIVITVHYTVAANDGTYASSAYGSVGLEAPEGNVIPYADLTPEIVIFWVQEKLGGEEKVAEISKRRSKNRLMSSAHLPLLLACRGPDCCSRHRMANRHDACVLPSSNQPTH
jgi:hypothetical protein